MMKDLRDFIEEFLAMEECICMLVVRPKLIHHVDIDENSYDCSDNVIQRI